MPPTFMEDLRSFWRPAPVTPGAYGQGEAIAVAPQCSANRYHMPPTTLAILLTDSGEHVVEPEGTTVEGLYGFFDIAQDGRWGGLLTSDWLTLDLAPCPCGLRSPAVIDCDRLDTRRAANDHD